MRTSTWRHSDTLAIRAKDHDAMKQLLSLLKKREEGYTLILANKEDLDQAKRQGFFERRKEVRFILSFFEVDKTLETIEAQLDYQLSEDVGDSEE